MAIPQLNLPESYLKWLDRVGEDMYAEFDGREWELANRKELLEALNIDGNQAAYVDQVKLYVKTIAEVTGESGTVDDEGNEVPFSRLETFLTIGRDNEDVLCVDPSDGFSVWCFCPSEGGDVEKLAPTLDDWLDQVELTE